MFILESEWVIPIIFINETDLDPGTDPDRFIDVVVEIVVRVVEIVIRVVEIVIHVVEIVIHVVEI